MDNFTLRLVSGVTIRLIAFLFFHEGLVASFLSYSVLRNVFVVFWIFPLGKFYLGDANVTVGLRCRRYGRTS